MGTAKEDAIDAGMYLVDVILPDERERAHSNTKAKSVAGFELLRFVESSLWRLRRWVRYGSLIADT